MGPTPKEKKKDAKQYQNKRKQRQREREVQSVLKFLFFKIFFLRFSSFCPSEFVGINTKSALGYA